MKTCMHVTFTLLGVLAIFVTLPTRVEAGPPNPAPILLTQPDGSTFEARVWGDEWSNGSETTQGYTIVLDQSSGYWVYAIRTSDGTLAPATSKQGALIVGRDDPAALTKHARPNAPTVLGRPSPSALRPQAYVRPNVGAQKTLVILVAFANRGPIGTTAATWRDKFFGSGKSVKSYYGQTSYNKLSLVPAQETFGTANDGVVGWLTLPYNHPNTRSATGDANRQIVRDAILAADPYVDFASFDTDHDGSLSTDELHIVTVIAGYETAYGGSNSCSPSIWGHRGALGWGSVLAPFVDNTLVGSWYEDGGYVQIGEWYCRTSYEGPPGHAATIGETAHELGHDLGLPDLYDPDFSTNGVGNWDLMGTGGWNTNGGYAGDLPAQLDPWSKWYETWLQPIQIIGSITGQSIPQSETNAKVFQLRDNPAGIDWTYNSNSGIGEYFLVENREKVGFDAGLPGCGLLIWHIDESVNSSNSGNADEWHRLIDLEQADGLFSLNKSVTNYGDAGDPYPGTRGNHTFNRTSSPNSNLYGGAPSGASVMNISGCAATMTANLSDGAPKTCYALNTHVNPTGSGSVTVNPPPNCNNGAYYTAGTTVQLTAIANTGSTFSNWSGDASGSSNPLNLSMNGTKNITANFVTPPANDDVANAIEIKTSPYNATVDARGGSTASDDPTFACYAGKGAASVWFRFTPSINGTLKVNTTGSNYDTVLAVWQGSRGALSSVACNDNYSTYKTSLVNANVIAGRTFYVEVAGKIGGGTLKFAAGFTPKKPAAPKLLSPVNLSKSTNPSQILDWTDSPGAAYYQVEVHKGSTIGTLADSAKPTGSTYTTKALTAALYYWRAGACNAVGCSWSGWWSFTILKPAKPVLQSPANGSTTANPVLFDWTDSVGAASYIVQVRLGSTSGAIVASGSPTVSTYTVTGLVSGKRYYWSARACSAAGCSAWTAYWSFVVQ